MVFDKAELESAPVVRAPSPTLATVVSSAMKRNNIGSDSLGDGTEDATPEVRSLLAARQFPSQQMILVHAKYMNAKRNAVMVAAATEIQRIVRGMLARRRRRMVQRCLEVETDTLRDLLAHEKEEKQRAELAAAAKLMLEAVDGFPVLPGSAASPEPDELQQRLVENTKAAAARLHFAKRLTKARESANAMLMRVNNSLTSAGPHLHVALQAALAATTKSRAKLAEAGELDRWVVWVGAGIRAVFNVFKRLCVDAAVAVCCCCQWLPWRLMLLTLPCEL